MRVNKYVSANQACPSQVRDYCLLRFGMAQVAAKTCSPLGCAFQELTFKVPQNWVAVKELKLSYYIAETLLFTIYTHYGNLI